MAGFPNGSMGPLAEFAARVGVPALLAVLVLTTLMPKIDRGIQIADRVDAQLLIIAATCARNGAI
jgi:hypothetical protein